MASAKTRHVPVDAMVIPASERQAHIDHMTSGVAWLGMLGQLRDAVLGRDWERAIRLAERRITYPQPYPDDG